MSAAVIGQPLPRVDGRLKVTGGATYAAEFARPKLTYGALIQSAIANGRVAKIDIAAAKSAPGVIGILTRENAPHFRPYPDDLSRAGAPGESRVPLQDDNIYFAGQHLGVIVAETFEQATYASSLVQVTYQQQPPVVTLGDERAQKSATWPEKFAGRDALQVKRGDVDAALATAAHKIDVIYSTPIENHNPIETYSTTAEWETPDHLLIHECTRGIKQLQRVVANAFGLQQDHVRIVCPFIGGAFGSKGFQWSHTLLAAAAAKLAQRPVKVTLTRPQMFDSAGQRARTEQRFSAGAEKDGKLVALRHATTTHSSPTHAYPEACGNMSRTLYSCPNVDVSLRLVVLNLTTPCPMRAPGKRQASLPWSARWTNWHMRSASIRSIFVCAITRKSMNTKTGPGPARSCENVISAVLISSAGRSGTENRDQCARLMARKSVSEWRQQFIQPVSKRRVQQQF